MKELNLTDAFAFGRVLKEAQVKDKVSEIVKDIEAGKKELTSLDVGFDVIYTSVMNLTDAKGEKLVYEFFAGAFEMDVDSVKKLTLKELKSKIKQLIDENKDDLLDFFSSATQSMTV